MKESLADATIRALTEGLHRNNIKAIKKVESKIQENYAVIDDASNSVLKKFNTRDEAQNAINTEVPEKYRQMYNIVDMSNISDKDNITDIPEQYVDKLYTESVETNNEVKFDLELAENDLFIVGTAHYNDNDYKIGAKVFLEGSEYGINEGPISKLSIKDTTSNELIINYDRGWDKKPNEQNKFLYNETIKALIKFREEHPYELTESVTETETTIELPNMCYTYIATDNAIGIIKYGENGYFPTNIPGPKEGTVEAGNKIVKQLNDTLGVTEKQAAIMQAKSMFGGWDKHDHIKPDKNDNLDEAANCTKNKILTETKSVSDYEDDIDLIIALESDSIKISTVDELNRVKAICEKLKNSQGFYGRLLNQLNLVSEDNLPIII